MTAFCSGEIVLAKIATQGLRAGEFYRVVDMAEHPTPFGNFCEYTVASLRPTEPGFEWRIVNAHLLLERAKV